MAYDNTKLEKAIRSWLRARTRVGKGSVYARVLLEDFVNYARENKLLKRSPGPVPFGRMLAELRPRLKKKIVAGLTHWTGIALKNGAELPEPSLPPETVKDMARQEADRVARAEQVRRKHNETDEDREAHKRRVKEEMKHETRERIEKAEAL